MLTKQSYIGVDWLTLTSHDAARGREWAETFGYIADHHAREGYLTEPSQSLGYVGQRCGKMFIGTRSDGYMARITGDWANAYGSLLSPDAVNVTRMDIQVTAWSSYEPADVLKRVWDGFQLVEKRRGGQTTGKFIAGARGIQTVNLGARQSQKFFRCYDKFEESGDEYYRGAVRYEEEAKGDYANRLAREVYAAESRQTAIRDILAGEFKARGVACPWANSGEYAVPPMQSTDAEVFVKLKWLREGVAPTVRRMVDAVGLEKIVEVLFGETAGYLDKDDIMRLIAQYLAENSQDCE